MQHLDMIKQPKDLATAISIARKKARADAYGFSEHPFTAVEYRKTLPKEWQSAVEDAIVEVYHTT